MKLKTSYLIVLLVIFCFINNASSESIVRNQLDTVNLQLKWKHQFQFAGYYAAAEKGYYEASGLFVNIIEAKTGDEVIPTVMSGRAQFGVAASDLLLVRSNGFPVVLLANIFNSST